MGTSKVSIKYTYRVCLISDKAGFDDAGNLHRSRLSLVLHWDVEFRCKLCEGSTFADNLVGGIQGVWDIFDDTARELPNI